ncbi:hypothetical protein [Falsiroseomonas selenitidurans]|uniref:Uncharacterized protein n=1 Tax=Falsiroseomonas selenitidurans TaxID=2716335 RepID=A0ABX1E803_9PROT|nr:hypothetical protein [Falsiroseomonas selenitidurans]NKC33334.1 hypothetical protein [Falsiroseomonas selenitidurans]
MRTFTVFLVLLSLAAAPSTAQPSCRVERLDYIDTSANLAEKIERCVLMRRVIEVDELRGFARSFDPTGAALSIGQVLAIRPLSAGGDVDLAGLAVPWFSRSGFHVVCERLNRAFSALNERCPLAGIFSVDIGTILNTIFTSDPRSLGAAPMLLHPLRIERAAFVGSHLRLEGRATSPIVVQSLRIEDSRLEYLALRHLVVLGNLEVAGSSASVSIENVMVLGDVDFRGSRLESLFVRGLRGAGTLRLSDFPVSQWSVRGAVFRSVVGDVEKVCAGSSEQCPDWRRQDIGRFITEAVSYH